MQRMAFLLLGLAGLLSAGNFLRKKLITFYIFDEKKRDFLRRSADYLGKKPY